MPSYGPGYDQMKRRAKVAAVPPVMAVLARVEQRLDRLDAGDAALAQARAETERLLRVIAERDALAAQAAVDRDNVAPERDEAAIVDDAATLRDALAEAERGRDEARTGWERSTERLAQAELELERHRTEIAAAAAARASLEQAVAAAIAERNAAARAAADLEGVTRERDEVARQAANLEDVTRERDAAVEQTAKLRRSLDEERRGHRELADRAADVEAELDRVRAQRDRLLIKAQVKDDDSQGRTGELAREIAGLKAELAREREHGRQRQQVMAHLRRQLDQAEAQLRDAARPADPADTGPFVLERDTGRRLVWWTGELVGDRPVTTGVLQAAKPLLTRGEAQAWLGQSRAFASFRAAPVPVPQAREASS